MLKKKKKKKKDFTTRCRNGITFENRLLLIAPLSDWILRWAEEYQKAYLECCRRALRRAIRIQLRWSCMNMHQQEELQITPPSSETNIRLSASWHLGGVVANLLLSVALKCSLWPLSLLESSTLQAGANSNYVDIDFVWFYQSVIIEKAVSKWYLTCLPYNEYCMKIKWDSLSHFYSKKKKKKKKFQLSIYSTILRSTPAIICYIK